MELLGVVFFVGLKWILLAIIIIGWIMWSKIEAKSNGGGYLNGIEQIKPFVIFLLAIIVWFIIF